MLRRQPCIESLESRISLSGIQPPTPDPLGTMPPPIEYPPVMLDPLDPLAIPTQEITPVEPPLKLSPPGDYPSGDPGLC